MFSGIGTPEIIVIVIVLIVLFGGKKVAKLAKGLGQSVTEIKKGFKDQEAEGEDK